MEEKIKDCTTCDWGKYNDHYNLPFCYCPEDCKNWDHWTENADYGRE